METQMASAAPDTMIDALVDTRSHDIDPKRMATILQMTQAELATMIGVHRTTLARNPGSREIQQALSPIATILSMAADMAGNTDKAVIWFRHQPVPPFGAKRPIDMVKEGKAKNVIEWLLALEDGAYG